MKTLVKITAIALFASASVSFAQDAGTPSTNPAPTPTTGQDRIDKRQEHQQKRIAEGLKNGTLTPEEAKKLEGREARIQNAEEKAKADGTVTAKEAAKIEKMQDRASKKIHRKKHNQ